MGVLFSLGLIVDWAVYGSAEVIDSSFASPYAITSDDVNRSEGLIDVTVPLQALVHHSQLSVPQGRSKSGLVGFYDPCYGERKRLVVMYTFKGKPHRAVVDDEALLLLPLRGEWPPFRHRCEGRDVCVLNMIFGSCDLGHGLTRQE